MALRASVLTVPRLNTAPGSTARAFVALQPRPYGLPRTVGSLFCGGWDRQQRNECGVVRQQQRASFASYSGRGKPTRTRVREEEREHEAHGSTADSPARRAPPAATRHEDSVAQQQRDGTPSRAMDSFGDAGLKQFMVNVCKFPLLYSE